MWFLFAAAPYAAGLVFVLFVYFLALPYVEYLRDPKGMDSSSQGTKKTLTNLTQV
jgi:hypothetical protein